jgi:hypothetical protein
MTSLPIVKKALTTQMVGNVVPQCGVPSLSPRSFAPLRINAPNQARETGRIPGGCCLYYHNRPGVTLFNFRDSGGIERLVPFGHAVRPKNYGSPLHDLGHCSLERIAIDIFHRSDHMGISRGAMVDQPVRNCNLDPPLVECRPLSGSGSAPVCFRVLPQTPSLFDAHILVGVVHHGIEPPSGMFAGEAFRRDPFLEEFPDGLVFGGVASIQEARAACSQFGGYSVWKTTSSLRDGTNP